MPSSSKSFRARFGPEAGQARHVDEPDRELRAQLLGRRDRARVEQRDWIFSSSVRPIPGSSVTLPSRVSAATDCGASRTALAALR